MKPDIRDERGVALVVSILAIVVIGGLIGAAFAPTMLEQRMGENMRRSTQAFVGAELGVDETVGEWVTNDWNLLPVGESEPIDGAALSGVNDYEGSVTRLNDQMYLVDAIGQDAGDQSRQRLIQFVKLRVLNIDIRAALTTRGETRVGGTAEIDGTDRVPPTWNAGSCAAPTSGLPGIIMPDTTALEWTGGNCHDGACVNGWPAAISEDPTISDGNFFEFGDMDWQSLVDIATVWMAPGTYQITPTINGTTCDITNTANWGAPLDSTHTCFNYFPIVHVNGDLNVNGMQGQGIVVIEGNLRVQGGFEFYGIILVRGTLETAGTGGHFNGAVLAANVSLDDNVALGDALVNYSSCAVARALRAGTMGAPIRSRGWMQAF